MTLKRRRSFTPRPNEATLAEDKNVHDLSILVKMTNITLCQTMETSEQKIETR
jgi:hypothetical protein